jgi:hypothetical protein
MVLPARVVEAIRGIGAGGVGMNLLNVLNGDRPRRALCKDGPRPCPWTACRFRLEPRGVTEWVLPAPTCALDVADLVEAGHDPPTLDVIARWMGKTKERIRQCEELGLANVALECRRRGMPVREKVVRTGSDSEVAILAAFERGPKRMHLKDVSEAVNAPPSAVRHRLARMARDGLVQRDQAGRWSLAR